jgi:hypothetical protein
MVNNKVIRLATVNALKANANVTTLVANSKIHNSKVTPHMFGNLPAIGVYTLGSATTGVNHVTPAFVKTLDINIEVAVAGNSATYMDTTDDIIFAVKKALFANTVWSGQFENVSGYREEITIEDAAETPVALSTLTISCEIVERT